MARPATADERAERRTRVARLMLCKHTQAEMAREVGVSRKTVNEDVAAIRAEWKQARIEAYDQYVAEDLALLAELQRAIAPAAFDGKWLATDRVLAIVDRRFALVGHTTAQRHEVKVEHTTAADAELDRLAQELGTRALEEGAVARGGAA